MSDNTPKSDPKYYRAAGQPPKLEQAAHTAYRWLFWSGIVLLVAAALVVVIGFAQGDNDYGQAGAFAFGGGTLQLALILLAAAGIVYGLGRRVGESQPGHAEQRASQTD